MNQDWKQKLTPEQYRILREKGTEEPFSGKYVNHKEDGIYCCVACGNPLFSSEKKFDSGSGWPSFTDVVNAGNVELKSDDSHGMDRTEVVCKNCGGHLGHVFEDLPRVAAGKAGGPQDKGGKRYCINSACLNFKKQ